MAPPEVEERLNNLKRNLRNLQEAHAELLGKHNTLAAQHEFDRQVLNDIGDRVYQLFVAVIELGIRGQDHETRITALENPPTPPA
jgi:putative hemolysin